MLPTRVIYEKSEQSINGCKALAALLPYRASLSALYSASQSFAERSAMTYVGRAKETPNASLLRNEVEVWNPTTVLTLAM